MTKLTKIIGITFVSQIIAFLNAVFSPFRGTILVFDEWEPQASKTALALGLVVVAAVVALNVDSSTQDLRNRTKASLAVTLLLAGACICIHFVIESGFAPSPLFVFVLRDIIWMFVYILMLVMVGVTIALAQLLLFPARQTGRGPRQTPPTGAGGDGRKKGRKKGVESSDAESLSTPRASDNPESGSKADGQPA